VGDLLRKQRGGERDGGGLAERILCPAMHGRSVIRYVSAQWEAQDRRTRTRLDDLQPKIPQKWLRLEQSLQVHGAPPENQSRHERGRTPLASRTPAYDMLWGVTSTDIRPTSYAASGARPRRLLLDTVDQIDQE
jgi:hypothetical protein